MNKEHILFVEDEAPFRKFAGRYLEDRGYSVTHAGLAAEAYQAFSRRKPDLVLLDLNLPDGHGLDVMRRLRERDADLRVVVLTAYGDAPTAVKALKAGATDYLTKPVRLEQLLSGVQEALAAHSPEGAEMAAESQKATRGVKRPGAGDSAAGDSERPVGEHPAWLRAVARLERVAQSGLTSLLILGESGTGKSALARYFHAVGAESGRPFVEIDCPSIPEALLESELFGHEKGAFTGATTRKRGQVETANGGTLFLDEIGELPLGIQPKLLRFLEQRRFRRVGGLEDREADVRLVCATNRDLRADVGTGVFRTDLYYRLEVVAIELPPLRERGDDVILIAEHLAQGFAGRMGREAPRFSEGAKEALRAHSFPGNVRELRNLVQRSVAFLEGEEIQAADLDIVPAESLAPRRAATAQVGASSPTPSPSSPDPAAPLTIGLERVLNAVEAQYVLAAVERTDSQREAGALLGVDRFAVARRMNRILRLGGPGAASAILENLPPWTQQVLGEHPGELGGEGVDLPGMRRELEDRAIAYALRTTQGNRARAANLLGISRTSLVRRLAAQKRGQE